LRAFIEGEVMRLHLLIAAALSMSAALADDLSPAANAERLKPVGEVNQQAQAAPAAAAPAAAATTAATTTVAKRKGDEIYNGKCVACHSAGVAGAPKKGELKDWQPRVTAAGKGPAALTGLLQVALKGKNAMPAKGTCMDCSDDELKSAIEYMVPPELLK
jgi:cytochrome c5